MIEDQERNHDFIGHIQTDPKIFNMNGIDIEESKVYFEKGVGIIEIERFCNHRIIIAKDTPLLRLC